MKDKHLVAFRLDDKDYEKLGLLAKNQDRSIASMSKYILKRYLSDLKIMAQSC